MSCLDDWRQRAKTRVHAERHALPHTVRKAFPTRKARK